MWKSAEVLLTLALGTSVTNTPTKCEFPLIVKDDIVHLTDRELDRQDKAVIKRAEEVCRTRYNKCTRAILIRSNDDKSKHYTVKCEGDISDDK